MSVPIFFVIFIQLKSIDFALFYMFKQAFLAPSLFALLNRFIAELLAGGDLSEVSSVGLRFQLHYLYFDLFDLCLGVFTSF